MHSPYQEDAIKLERCLGKGFVANDGLNIYLRCPVCKDTREEKKKLVVRLDDGRYHCWVCESKGRNVISFLAKNGHPEARGQAFSFAKSDRVVPIVTQENEIVKLPDDIQLLVDADIEDPDVRASLRYVTSRGLSESDIVRHRLSFSRTYRFRRRVIFPSFDAEGQLNYFVARSIDPDVKPKYKNARTDKVGIVFNEVDIDWTRPLVLVEGPFDLTKCAVNATCLLGSSLPEKSRLYQMIASHRTPVILALDLDAEDKCHRVASFLYSAGCEVSKCAVSNRDIGDMTKKEALEVFRSARPWSPMDRLSHKISHLRSGTFL